MSMQVGQIIVKELNCEMYEFEEPDIPVKNNAIKLQLRACNVNSNADASMQIQRYLRVKSTQIGASVLGVKLYT